MLEMPAAHVSAAASDFHIAPCLTQTLPVSTAADVHVSPAMHQTTVAPTLLHRPYHTSLKYWTLRSLRSASFRRSWMPKSCGHGRQGQRGMERRSLLGGNRVINIFSFVVVDDHSLANRINAAPTSVGVLQSAVGKNLCRGGRTYIPNPHRILGSAPRAHSRCPRPLPTSRCSYLTESLDRLQRRVSHLGVYDCFDNGPGTPLRYM